MGRIAALVLGAAAFVCFVMFIVCYAEAVYAYGGGYYSLLASVVLTGAALEMSGERVQRRKVVACTSATAALFALSAVIAGSLLAAQPYSANSGWVARPVFALLVVTGCGILAVKNARAPSAGDLEIMAVEKGMDVPAAGNKCATCCKSCLWVFVMFLVALASVNTIMLTGENIKYAPEPEAMIMVDGRNVHTRCKGEGEPVVFFEHGWSGNSLDFTWVQEEVSKVTRTCSYDRPGYGRSIERGELERTSDRLANETKVVLDTLNIKEAVFVGHSFAGFNLRVLESRHPELFKGIVFVDMVNPNNTGACDPEETYPLPFETVGMMLTETGVMRILDMIGFVEGLVPINFLPDAARLEYKHQLIRVGWFKSRIDEWRYWGRNCDMVKKLEGAEKVIEAPISVVVPKLGIHQNNLEYARELMDISADGRGEYIQIDDERADHNSILYIKEFADLISDETKRLVELVRADTAQ